MEMVEDLFQDVRLKSQHKKVRWPMPPMPPMPMLADDRQLLARTIGCTHC